MLLEAGAGINTNSVLDNDPETHKIIVYGSEEVKYTKGDYTDQDLSRKLVAETPVLDQIKMELPTSLEEALASRSLRVVQDFLDRNFESVARADYMWLHELDDAGYSKREIATVLLEDKFERPWIYFTPKQCEHDSIQDMLHIRGCAHQVVSPPLHSAQHPEQPDNHVSLSHADVRREVEELCGIGGVAPVSRNTDLWSGSVSFDPTSNLSISRITYAINTVSTEQSYHNATVVISKVLTNLSSAIATVQNARLCCNSFTVLVQDQKVLRLRRIEVRRVRKMTSLFESALHGDYDRNEFQECAQYAKDILLNLAPSFRSTRDSNIHCCAIAAQFLCTGFLCYIQAHIGHLDPFFLDTPQQGVVLLGTQSSPGGFNVSARLVDLTCLSEMTQQQVFAFCPGTNTRDFILESTVKFDVVACIEDCLDTWGPGYLVHNMADPSKVHAVVIGGGYISKAGGSHGTFHWTKGSVCQETPYLAFEFHEMMRIGACVAVKQNCCMDEAMCRRNSFCALRVLGTRAVFWETKERQFGIQGGQYFNGIYNQTWKRKPGITLKQKTLQQPKWLLLHFLNQNWGLQVSFCTSVARRVPLRELIMDLLPMFVNPLEPEWQELLNQHDVLMAFAQEDPNYLIKWLHTLSASHQEYVLSLIRIILEQLQHTGLDQKGAALLVAWPQEGDIGRGLEIPCESQTCWARIIADAEDCATFAYITSKCLETKTVKCQGDKRAWQNLSKLLVTEMSPSRPKGEPCINISTSVAVGSGPTATSVPMMSMAWELEDRKTYYIKKLDSLLRVKAKKPSSLGNDDVTHLEVLNSSLPQAIWKRILSMGEEGKDDKIRERQAIGDHAECVVVRAERC